MEQTPPQNNQPRNRRSLTAQNHRQTSHLQSTQKHNETGSERRDLSAKHYFVAPTFLGFNDECRQVRLRNVNAEWSLLAVAFNLRSLGKIWSKRLLKTTNHATAAA